LRFLILIILLENIGMPIRSGYDAVNKQYYMIWGSRGKKYYYNPKNPQSEQEAYKKASAQARAAYSHGYRPK
jgi:hypothetical protein